MQTVSRGDRQRGFTITELFLSIVIVFIVAVLFLLPIVVDYGSGHHKAPMTAELSNQKQLGIAFLMYAQDYDNHYPPAASWVDFRKTSGPLPLPPYSFWRSWGPTRRLPDGRELPGLLMPYAKVDTLFLSPVIESRNKDRILEFMYNDLLASQSLGDLTSPADTVMMTDAENRLANAGHALTRDSGPFGATFNRQGGCDAGKGASVRSARLRASGGAAFTYADGHARWSKGGADDAIFFPPRESASRTSVDLVTKKRIGPKPGGDSDFKGRHYRGTFHLR